MTVDRHRLRVHSYPKDQISDHTYHLIVIVGTKSNQSNLVAPVTEINLLNTNDFIADRTMA